MDKFLATYQAGCISQNTELVNLSERVYAAGQYMQEHQVEIESAMETQAGIYAEVQAEYDKIFEEECRARQEDGWKQVLKGGTLVTAAVAVTLLSGCTTLPETIAVGIAGGTMMVCGAGLLTEGTQNVYYGSIGDLTSVAVNPVCEVFFGGNEKNFDTFCYYDMMFLSMYMLAGAGSVSGMVVEGVQECIGDGVSTYVTSYVSSTCNLSDFESVLIGTTTNFLIDPGLDAIGSHSLGGGTHFSQLNHDSNTMPDVTPHLNGNQLDMDMHILNDVADMPPNTVIDGVELPEHFYGGVGGVSALAQYGDEFGKMGTYVENPDIKVDWTQYAEHASERMQQRGMTQEMVNNIVENGKVLSQNNGNKFTYITQEGVAIVSKKGKLITAWSSADFDSSMLEIISKLFGE